MNNPPPPLEKREVLAIIDRFLSTRDTEDIQPNTFIALNRYFNTLSSTHSELSDNERFSFDAFKTFYDERELNEASVMQTFSNIRRIVNKYNTPKRPRNNNTDPNLQRALEQSMKNEKERKRQKKKQEETNHTLAFQLQEAELAAAEAGTEPEIERQRRELMEIERAEAAAANPNNIQAINNFAQQLQHVGPEVRINGVVPELNRQDIAGLNLRGREKVGAAAYALAGMQALMQTGVSRGCNLVGTTGRFISWACRGGVPAMNALLSRINVLINIYAEKQIIPANIKSSIILAINGFKSRVMWLIPPGNARDNMIRLANETDQRVQEIPQQLNRSDENIYEKGRRAAYEIRQMGPVINGQFMKLLLSLVESENAKDFGDRAQRAECTVPLIHTTYEEEKASAAGVLVQFVELVKEMNAMNGEAIRVSNTQSQQYRNAVEKRRINKKPIKRNIRTEWKERNKSNGIGVCVGGTVEDVTTFIAEMRGALPMTAYIDRPFSQNLNTLLDHYIKNMISSGLPDNEETFIRSLDNLVVTLFTPLLRAYVRGKRSDLFIYLYEKVELYLKYYGFDQIKLLIGEKYPLDKPIILEYRSQVVTEDNRRPWDGVMETLDWDKVNMNIYARENEIIDAPLPS